MSLRDEERVAELQAQWRSLEAYLRRWLWNDDGSFKAGFNQFETAAEFEETRGHRGDRAVAFSPLGLNSAVAAARSQSSRGIRFPSRS